MDTQLADRVDENLAELMTWLTETIKSSDGFVREQAPLVAQEIVRWGIFEAAALGVVWIAAGILAWWILLMASRACKTAAAEYAADALQAEEDRKHSSAKDATDSAEVCTVGKVIAWLLAWAAGFAGLVTGVCMLVGMIKPIVAPRLYIIDWITKFMG